MTGQGINNRANYSYNGNSHDTYRVYTDAEMKKFYEPLPALGGLTAVVTGLMSDIYDPTH